MATRKINAALSLLVTLLLLVHAFLNSVWLLPFSETTKPMGFVSWVLAGALVLHVFISIDLAISGHMDGKKGKSKNYPKLNTPTIVQRVTGVLMIIFTGLHVSGASGLTHPPQIVHAILPPLFFTLVFAHVAVSTSKAFITLGIGNAKFIKVADIVTKVVCIFTLISDIVGFYLYRY